MTAEIIDAANELTQQRIDMAIAAPGCCAGMQDVQCCQRLIEMKNKQRGIM